MLLWGALLATALVIAWALGRAWRIAAVGSAYRSKVLCSLVFVSGRTVDPRRVEDVADDEYWPLRFFSSHVDAAARTVTTSLFGLRPRTATFRAGLGSTLFLARAGPGASRPLPDGASRAATAALKARPASSVQQVVDRAFTEPNPKRLRRTRAIVVLHDGDVVAERYAPGFTVDTPLAGWSMAKSVLNALVGILVGQQRLSLTDTALLP